MSLNSTALVPHPHAIIWRRDVWNEERERERIRIHTAAFADGWYLAMSQLEKALGLSYNAFSQISAPPYTMLRDSALDATSWASPDEPGYVIACEYAMRHSREHQHDVLSVAGRLF